MYRSTRVCLGLMAALTFNLSAENVFVFPEFSTSNTDTVTVYNGAPLAPVGTFTASSDAFKILTKPTNLPAEVKYYVLTRGSSSIIILNNRFERAAAVINTGQQVIDAVLTPDGKRLYALSGSNLRVYDTATDQQIQIQQSIQFFVPDSLLVSPDSKTLYVHSSDGQVVRAVDVDTNTLLGAENQVSLPLTTQTSMTIGPDGLLYISAEDKILIYDTTRPLGPPAFIRQIALPTGAGVLKPKIGPLRFTPDGTRAIAVNLSPNSGSSLFYILLDPANPRVAGLSSNDPNFTGASFTRIAIVSNERAYVIGGTSTNPRKLYRANLQTGLDANGLLLFPELTEAEFGSLGTVASAAGLAPSGEFPTSRRLYINAPLSLTPGAAPGTPNKVYDVNLVPTIPTVVLPELTTSFVASLVAYAGPAYTAAGGFRPGAVFRYGVTTAELPLNTRTIPFGIRVVDELGRPLFNQPVTITIASGPATLNGPSTVFTNDSGFVASTLTTGSTPGDVTVSVAVQGSGLTVNFNYRVSTTPGSGPGTPPGGSTGIGKIIILEGDGVVMKEGNFSDAELRQTAPGAGRTKIRVLDSNDKPVPNTTVTWAVISGGGRWAEGAPSESSNVTTVTDAAGETSNIFIATNGIGSVSFVQTVASASTSSASVEIHFIAIPSQSDGNSTTFPTATRLAPTGSSQGIVGKAGTVIKGAIQYQFQAFGGAIVPNVGFFVDQTRSDPNGPSGVCDPNPIAIANEQGIATCDLKLTGRTGKSQINLVVGGYSTPQLPIEVLAGDPSVLKILNGDNQTGRPGDRALGNLVVELGDGGGNTLPSASIRWEVIQGTATLDNSTTITDQAGRASNGIRFANVPGPVQVRATALSGTRPSVTFNFSVTVVVSGLAAAGGSGQTTFINTNFAQLLAVRVTDAQNNPVANAVVTFTLVSGSASLSAPTAPTGTDGIARVTLRAGDRPGPIVVQASVQGITQLITFTATSTLPGPQINRLDFFNTASGQRGAVVPGGVYTFQGLAIAPDLRGCTTANTVLGSLPTRLAGIEVQFGAFLAPIFRVCNENNVESVTVQVPFELAGESSVNVTVRVGAGSSVINGVEVTSLQPGVFETTDSQGRRFAVALRPDGSFVTPDNPARYGEIIRVYITGAGQVSPTARTGVTGITGQQLTPLPIVGVNDSGVRVVSATYAIGLVGVYEVAFELPSGTQTGPARPLGVLMVRPNGEFVFPSNSPTIAIQP